MTKKIFRSILAVASTVLLASLVVVMGCLYDYYRAIQEKQLKDELQLAACGVAAEALRGSAEKSASGSPAPGWACPS